MWKYCEHDFLDLTEIKMDCDDKLDKQFNEPQNVDDSPIINLL